MQNSKAKLEHEFTEVMQREVTEFLFNHYRVHFQSRPALAQAYACIPQVCCSLNMRGAQMLLSHQYKGPFAFTVKVHFLCSPLVQTPPLLTVTRGWSVDTDATCSHLQINSADDHDIFGEIPAPQDGARCRSPPCSRCDSL